MDSTGFVDFGAHVPCGAQLRPRITVAKETGWRVRAYRKLRYQGDVSEYQYRGDSAEDAESAFWKAVNSGHFEYVSLINLTTNTLIKDYP